MAALFTLCLLGCGEQKIGKAQELIKATLTDPGSAQFTEVAVSKGNTGVVCGLVNSKNKFGGYAGPKRFYADVTTKQTQVDPEQALTPEAREMFGGLGRCGLCGVREALPTEMLAAASHPLRTLAAGHPSAEQYRPPQLVQDG
jgi:hypothetical protein